MSYSQIIKKKFHLNQIQLFHLYKKYFKKYSDSFFLENNILFIKNNSLVYTLDLNKGTLENFYFITISPNNNSILKSDKINIRLLFPLKNSFNIFSKRSIYNFSWNIIGTYSEYYHINEKNFQIFLKSNLNFSNLIYEIYYTIYFNSSTNNINNFLTKKKIQDLNMKIFIINKKNINIKFKSLVHVKFIMDKFINPLITKRIFGLQGLKYFEKNDLKINTSKFLTLNSTFGEAIYINVTREKLFLIINPEIIYKIENKRGFSDSLIQCSKQIISIGSGNLIKSIYLKKKRNIYRRDDNNRNF
uniref:Uncharacterized protein n=1 Tax=Lotharella oceanica TaxID=641309 RepID=A0A7S2TSL1_9EUKA|mmetsp:Transcript_28096/g.52469  ORF Transcript_28096/g.52469 Transcript_28096/m.52469 type:complete len:302 (+) Transcript_28096:57-962(+)